MMMKPRILMKKKKMMMMMMMMKRNNWIRVIRCEHFLASFVSGQLTNARFLEIPTFCGHATNINKNRRNSFVHKKPTHSSAVPLLIIEF